MSVEIIASVCPCGSGRALRACHGAVTAAGGVRQGRLRLAKREITRAFTAANARRGREPDVWGAGAPPAALDLDEGQAVFVNRQLFTKRECRTVGDFLRFYLTHRLPPASCDRLEEKEGSAALLRLAHDLYELEHAGLLPRAKLKQLQQARRSAGARRDLSLAAALLRSGYELGSDLGHARFRGAGETYRFGGVEPGEPGLQVSRLSEMFIPGTANLVLSAQLDAEAKPEVLASSMLAQLKHQVRKRRWSVALVIFGNTRGWSEAHLVLPAAESLARGEVRSRLVAPSADLKRRRPALHAVLSWLQRARSPYDLPLIAKAA